MSSSYPGDAPPNAVNTQLDIELDVDEALALERMADEGGVTVNQYMLGLITKDLNPNHKPHK
jgi:hypothetical protein